jgi:hypothetical protein
MPKIDSHLRQKTYAFNLIPFGFALSLAVVFGILSYWKVFEYDLFFNVKAGKEILETWRIQKVDTWSHTAYGQRWVNFEWLSCVFQYLASRVQNGYAFSGLLRSLLVGFWTFSLVRFSQKESRSQLGQSLLPWLFAPWIYIISYFRLQMRPDLFATIHFLTLYWIWYSDLCARNKRLSSLFVLFSWANFHGGTAPIGVVLFSAWILFDSEVLLTKLKWIAAAGATWFLTPIGLHVLEPVWESLISYDHELWKNPDFQPFSLSLFTLEDGGWSLSLWALYTLVALMSYLYLVFRHPKNLPKIYPNFWMVPIVGSAMTALTFNKIRMLHYQAIFFLPIVAAAFGVLIENYKKNIKVTVCIVVFIAFLWIIIIPDQVRVISKRIGSGLSELELPIQTVEFIRKVRPSQNLLNPHPFGGYIIAELPDYPVSIDGRGPFAQFLRETQEARSDTQKYIEFLKKYRINTVIEELPVPIVNQQLGFVDSHEFYYPKSDWALVYFDQVSVLYLRRIPAHQDIISQFEYHFIRRGLPANFGSEMKDLPEPVRAGFEAELDQCLRRYSNNIYCLVGKSTFLKSRGQLTEALQILLTAEEVDPKNTEMLFHLSQTYEKMGNSDEYKKVMKRFNRLTSARQSFLTF